MNRQLELVLSDFGHIYVTSLNKLGPMNDKLNRRQALAALAGVAFGLPAGIRSPFAEDPFTLGVASGDPLPDGIVLWTRLATSPLEGGGMGPGPVTVNWRI